MLWVPKRTFSPQKMLKIMGKKYLQFYANIFVYLNLWATP